MKPSWDKAPEWATHLSLNYKNDWYWCRATGEIGSPKFSVFKSEVCGIEINDDYPGPFVEARPTGGEK